MNWYFFSVFFVASVFFVYAMDADFPDAATARFGVIRPYPVSLITHHARRRSRVNGASLFSGGSVILLGPGVWPIE
ncbi:MAG: hypothetical protein JWL69_18 [Phycisphaerales bacterium]|nr:hypothetical protein [Phycisphaerales bacterium]